MKYFWRSRMSLVSIGLRSAEKNITTPFNPFFHIVN